MPVVNLKVAFKAIVLPALLKSLYGRLKGTSVRFSLRVQTNFFTYGKCLDDSLSGLCQKK